MSFWQNVGASVGIGACKLEVEVENPTTGWGEPVWGTVRITGGVIPQRVTQLGVALVQHWTSAMMVGKTVMVQHHYHTHDATQLDSNLEIASGESREYRFRLTAPWSGPFNHEWLIGARASIPGAVDRGAARPFRLTAPPAFVQVAEVLAEVSRMPVGTWRLAKTGGAWTTFVPGTETRAVLDGVRLELTRSGDSIEGRIDVNPQERSAAGVVRSLVGADRRSSSFRCGLEDLSAARAAFEEALRPDLDALRHLPIPAVNPGPDAAVLPRVSASALASDEAGA